MTRADFMNLSQALYAHFGYSEFRSKQENVIKHVMKNGHALVIMPTGMGKSICYQLPALLQGELTLVISPLIALMKDQVDALNRKNIDAAFINSSLGKREREARYKAVADGEYKLLYVTPERFRKAEFVEVIRKRNIGLLAVDEAHCISEWGHDFRPDYTRLYEFRKIVGEPATIALTATATADVQDDIIKQLGLQNDEVEVFHEGIERPNLHLDVKDAYGESGKLNCILEMLKQQSGSGIIYFSLIKTLKGFSELLFSKKIRHYCYHGDLEPGKRKSVQNSFMKERDALVLATNAFGMGIDKEDIRFVLHAEIPGSIEEYYQEIGRAGRDGKDAWCWLLYDERDLLIQMEFVKWSNPGADFYERVYNFLVEDIEQVNGYGLDVLKEKLIFKNRRDYRLETVLGMFDRYHVTEGRLEHKNLRLVNPLPDQLADPAYLENKLKREQRKLYSLVQYVNTDENRKAFIHSYFGIPWEPRDRD